MAKKYQIVGIGNAMVDVLSNCSDAFLARAGVEKGIMQLTDMARALELYAQVGPAKEISGGSAANTIAAAAQLGGRVAYVGKIKDDQLGAIFAHDMRAQGVVYETTLGPRGQRGGNRVLHCAGDTRWRTLAEHLSGVVGVSGARRY